MVLALLADQFGCGSNLASWVRSFNHVPGQQSYAKGGAHESNGFACITHSLWIQFPSPLKFCMPVALPTSSVLSGTPRIEHAYVRRVCPGKLSINGQLDTYKVFSLDSWCSQITEESLL